MAAYKRILLKLSGEALKGERAEGYEPEAVKGIVSRWTWASPIHAQSLKPSDTWLHQ